jgi:uncharacterized lipoprotein YddW (UPF0748 family)
MKMARRSITSAFIVLTILALTGCKEVFTGKREARGVWISRFEYADIDSTKSKTRITEIFERARTAKLNMIFFQVRGTGDAYYKSQYEPWAEPLTGTLGKNPGWDPLEYAVREAHRLGLELHAWINTFTIWSGKKPPVESSPRSVYLAHPEWLVCGMNGKPMPLNDHYINISPGVPEARSHVVKVALDIVNKYDIDGVHFDYVRYPEDSPKLGYSHDSISVARFNSVDGNPDRMDWDNWQREQVNQFVFSAYNAIIERKPWIKISASVVGKYSGTGWTAYTSVYQDVRRWMELGKMDFVVPMVYWEMDHKTHPFGPLVTEWTARVAYDRQVMPGILMGLEDKFGWSEISNEIDAARTRGAVGVVFFSAATLEKTWGTLGTDKFPYWSDVPPMTWKDSIAPQAPATVQLKTSGKNVKISWNIFEGKSGPLYCNIYRSSSPVIDTKDAKSILFVTARSAVQYIDSTGEGRQWYYAVTALNRAGNESSLSNVAASDPALAASGERKSSK